MSLTRYSCALVVFALAASVSSTGRAAFHLWKIQEVFSNEDGSVQFIELFCPPPAANEFFLNNHPITAMSDGTPVTFNLNHDLTGQTSTAGRTFLLATAGFVALPGGVAPDYALPSDFFNPNAASISINFANVDTLTFAGSLLPKDGVNSLLDHDPAGGGHLVTEINSPKNFAGAMGSIEVGAATPLGGDFNEDMMVDSADLAIWKTGFGADAAHSQGDADQDADVDGADLLAWQRQFGQSTVAVATSPIPEPASLLPTAIAAIVVATFGRRCR